MNTTAPAFSILARMQTITLPWPTSPWLAYSGALIGLIALVQGLITLFERPQAGNPSSDIEKSGQTPDKRRPYRQRLSWTTFIAPRNILLGAMTIAFYYTDQHREMGTVICGLATFYLLDAIYIAGDERPQLASMLFCALVGLIGAANAEPGSWASWPALAGALIGVTALIEGLLVLLVLFSHPAQSGQNLSGPFTSGQTPHRGWAIYGAARDDVFGIMIVVLFQKDHCKEMGILISGLNTSSLLDSAGWSFINETVPHPDLMRAIFHGFVGLVGAALVFQWTWSPFES